MNLVRWDPFRDFRSMRRLTTEVEDSYGTWAPVVDIFERGDDLIIRAEVAGLDKDDVDISVENNTLTLRGERKREMEFEEKDAYRLERLFGVFTRSFMLPKTVDSTRISASYKNGVLELTIPKVEQARPRRIEIKAA
ncbi:MAG: Hsp20/alpha crystallin family protein [Candidatus Polarisedimenticolia bacterium]